MRVLEIAQGSPSRIWYRWNCEIENRPILDSLLVMNSWSPSRWQNHAITWKQRLNFKSSQLKLVVSSRTCILNFTAYFVATVKISCGWTEWCTHKTTTVCVQGFTDWGIKTTQPAICTTTYKQIARHTWLTCVQGKENFDVNTTSLLLPLIPQFCCCRHLAKVFAYYNWISNFILNHYGASISE